MSCSSLTSTRAFLRLLPLLMLQGILLGCSSTTTLTPVNAPQHPTLENTAPVAQESTLGQLLPLISTDTINDPSALLNNDIALQALPAAVREQRWQIAKTIINKTDVHSMSIDNYAHFSIWTLAYLNQSGQFMQAEQLLNSAYLQSKMPLIAADDQVALTLARAKMLYGLNRFTASAQQRVFIEDLTDDSELNKQNQYNIWQTLLKLPIQQLKLHAEKSPSRSYKGWLELAIIYRNNQLSITEQSAATKAWQRRWAKQLPDSVKALKNISIFRHKIIGVFLPLSGRLATVGNAIKDGIAYAYFNANSDTEQAPALKFYDTAQGSIEQLYSHAMRDEVELIIGPLEKSKVAELFTMPTDVPIITLNFINDSLPPTNVIQFGLAIEDEAVQLAQLARSTQHQNILLLHTEKDWANRASATFKSQWLNFSNTSLTNKKLSIADNYSQEIAQSLHLDKSHARHKALNNVLGKKMVFKPRRRQDVDLIVLFADTKQAKAIKPLLAYHYAEDIPVLASSKVFDGTNHKSNGDLNGVIFNEMPWLLRSRSSRSQAVNKYANNKSLNRLFAMGIDAFYLHPRINYLKQSPLNELSGATGRISLRSNKIVRSLSLATIKKGAAVSIDEKNIPPPKL